MTRNPVRPGPIAHRITSKPSKHYGTDFWCYDGPLDGRQIGYKGKRAPYEMKVNDVVANGEYRHESRNVGPKLGYEHYYQWYGPSPEMLADRAAK